MTDLAQPANPSADAAEPLRRALELDIVLGRLRPRERLVEDELMARFGAKRHAVRAALAALDRAGLVTLRRHRGAAVREYGAEEIEELYAFRSALHALAVAAMPLPIAPEATAALAALADRHEGAVAEGRLADVILLNDAFHDALFALCGNRFLAASIGQLDRTSQPVRSRRIGDPALLRQAVAEHRAMIAAARAGERAGLAELCERHILPSKRLYLRDGPIGARPSDPPQDR